MAGTGPGDLDDLMQELKTVAVAALDSIPGYPATSGLDGAPERSFVSPGVPVWDCCDMLAVHAQGVTDKYALPNGHTAKLNTPNLIVTATRCIPQGEVKGQKFHAPAVAAMEAAAAQIHADGWALWNHIWNAINAGVFLTACTEVTFNGMLPVTPEGGCAGWQLSFNVVLDGYPETFGT